MVYFLGPSHPQNVQVQAISSVSIRVRWDEPAQPNGVIDEYIIYYGTSNAVQSTEQKVTGKTRERVIDGLEKFTTYFVKVRGKTSKIGNASEIFNATTFEDSKCIIVIASCNNISTETKLQLSSCMNL